MQGRKTESKYESNGGKSKKIVLFGKSHETVELTKRHGYEYKITTPNGYDKYNWLITGQNLLWKIYNDHVLEEIQQLRGWMSRGVKVSCTKGG